MTNKLKYYNLYLNCLNYEDVFLRIENFLNTPGISSIFFLNAHYFNLAQKDEEYRQCLNSADLLLNDGIGVKLGGKISGISFKTNMAGTDLIPAILEKYCIHDMRKVFLLGGKPGIADEITRKRNDLNIGGFHHGYFSTEESQYVIDKINSTKCEFLIIGMGSPIQEKWFSNNRKFLKPVKICICGGAILDFMSGKVPRSPKILRQFGMEWLFRLTLEPKRLFNRYMIGNFLFIYYIFRFKLKND